MSSQYVFKFCVWGKRGTFKKTTQHGQLKYSVPPKKGGINEVYLLCTISPIIS